MHTANKTLSQVLKETREAEKRHDIELAEMRAKQEGPKAAENFALVREFYRTARAVITEQILERRASNRLGVLVGDDGTQQAHGDVWPLLNLGSGSAGATCRTAPYYCLWLDFEQWAVSEGLCPFWSVKREDDGQRIWYVLTVAEQGPTQRGH